MSDRDEFYRQFSRAYDKLHRSEKQDDLVERVARAMWMADVEPYDPADRIPFEQAPEGAQAYCRAEARAAIAVALEEAAKLCDERIALLHGQFDVLDVTRECDAYRIAAAAIRALIPKEPT